MRRVDDTQRGAPRGWKGRSEGPQAHNISPSPARRANTFEKAKVSSKHTGSLTLRPSRHKATPSAYPLERAISFDTRSRPRASHSRPSTKRAAPKAGSRPGMKAALRQRGALRYPRREPRIPPSPFPIVHRKKAPKPFKLRGFPLSCIRAAGPSAHLTRSRGGRSRRGAGRSCRARSYSSRGSRARSGPSCPARGRRAR